MREAEDEVTPTFKARFAGAFCLFKEKLASRLPFLGRLFPYLILLLVSAFPLWFWFAYPGITSGDDAVIQIPLVYDILYGFQHGFFDSTNHLYLGDYALNAGLFYGMLPHYGAALSAYLFGWLGCGVLDGIKFVAYLSYFISAVFTYKLALRMTGRGSIALAAGILYVFIPYRSYALLYRFALSEATAIAFIPVFFYGLYMVIHEEKAALGNFLALLFGTVGLIDSHPFTALISVGVGAVYALFNVANVIKRIKGWRFNLYLVTTVVIAVFLVFPFVFPLLEALGSGLYRVSDETIMWTYPEYLVNAAKDSTWRAGFLNFEWLTQYGPGTGADTPFRWGLGLTYFPFLCLFAFLIDSLIARKSSLPPFEGKLIRTVVLTLVMLLPPLLLQERVELMLGAFAFYAGYLLYFIVRDKKEVQEASVYKRPWKEETVKLFTDVDLYAVLLLLAFGFVCLFSLGFWRIAPAILRECQFPFRFWSIVGFLLLFLALILVKPIRRFRFTGAFCLTVAAYFALLSQGMVDKRIYYIDGGNPLTEEPTAKWVKNMRTYGWQNEYLPLELLDIGSGKTEPSYGNSLAVDIGAALARAEPVPQGIEEYPAPVFLEGKGEANITYLNTPEVAFELASVEGDSLLQLPQFYYDGYRATAVYEDGTRIDCPIENVDGLVAISLPEGDFDLEITYPGPALKVIGRYLALAGGFLLLGLMAFSIFDTRRGKGLESA